MNTGGRVLLAALLFLPVSFNPQAQEHKSLLLEERKPEAGLLLNLDVDARASSTEDAPDIMKKYLHDQALFEQKVRSFDKLHVALARGWYVKARTLEEKGDADGARAAYADARQHLDWVKDAYELGLDTFEKSAPLHTYYGELLHDFYDRANEAAVHWNRAIQLDSKCARAHGNVGMYSFHIGMYHSGLHHMDRALELEPNNPDFLFNMAQIYLTHFLHVMPSRRWDRACLYKEAMKLSEKAATLCPNDFDVLRDYALNFFLGKDFGVTVDWRKAAKAWQTARHKARNDAELFNCWLNEARVHLRNNDRRKADPCLEAAQAIWPDSPVVKHLLEDIKEDSNP